MRADEPGFAVAQVYVAFCQLNASGPQALDLPALEYQTGLEPVLDEIVVPCASIHDNRITRGLARIGFAHWLTDCWLVRARDYTDFARFAGSFCCRVVAGVLLSAPINCMRIAPTQANK